MGFEGLKNQGKLHLKPGYDPKQCYLMLYFGAHALKRGKGEIQRGEKRSI